MSLSAEQISNAKVIINVGRQLGASDRDITIALMAGFQESGLRNLNYGDRDSIGMFQQRTPWGSRADRLDPVKASRMFFLGGAGGQRGLLDFKSRDQMTLGQAAQRVQVSAFPDAYDKWENDSNNLMKELGGGSQTQGSKPTDSTIVPETGLDEHNQSIVPGYASPAQDQAQGALSALGVGSPTSTGSDAPGAGAMNSPGAESADQQPQLNSLDLGGMVDPTVTNQMNIPQDLLGGTKDLTGGSLAVDDSGGNLGRRLKYSGVTLDQYTMNRVSAANTALGYNLQLSQGSYNKGGVAASAGTHDGGGAMDVSIKGKSQSQINAIVKALRQAGFAAWYRTADEGKWSPHVHAIAIGDPWLSSSAANQVKDFQNGGDGLAN